MKFSFLSLARQALGGHGGWREGGETHFRVAIVSAGFEGLGRVERQRRVRHVFVTHEHLDHVATLPIFLENVYDPGP